MINCCCLVLTNTQTREYSMGFIPFYSSERRLLLIGLMSECHSFPKDLPEDELYYLINNYTIFATNFNNSLFTPCNFDIS